MTRWILLALLCMTGQAFGQTTRPTTAPTTRPVKVAYIMDASGPMKEHWTDAIEQVAKAIDVLGPDSSFAIIVATEGKSVTLGRALMKPTEQRKQAVWDYLRKQSPAGRDDVAGAARAAAELKPDLV